MSRVSFEQAKRQYPHRYTMEHVPEWAKKPLAKDKYYAPQFSSDREWFENTKFPPESGHRNYCMTSNQSWPLGNWLTSPYVKPSFS